MTLMPLLFACLLNINMGMLSLGQILPGFEWEYRSGDKKITFCCETTVKGDVISHKFFRLKDGNKIPFETYDYVNGSIYLAGTGGDVPRKKSLLFMSDKNRPDTWMYESKTYTFLGDRKVKYISNTVDAVHIRREIPYSGTYMVTEWVFAKNIGLLSHTTSVGRAELKYVLSDMRYKADK